MSALLHVINRSCLHVLIFSSVVLLSACGDGSGGSSAVDADHDGLIDISSLKQLDWMRNDLKGTSLNDGEGNVLTDGCPDTGCNGYELMVDLDFDTNGDGVINQNDDYYNDGKGWLPVGTYSEPFNANFEGNRHTIHNLTINRMADDAETAGQNIGLFGYVESLIGDIYIQNLTLDGSLMNISGNTNTGGLTGTAHKYVQIINVSSDGVVTGQVNTGGMIGSAIDDVEISQSSDSSTVNGVISTGGLIGSAANNTQVYASHTSGVIYGVGSTGGLIGNSSQGVTITACNSTAQVAGIDYKTGGLVGSASTTSIESSQSQGSVTGTQQTGGLVGEAKTSSSISNSQSTASVDGGVYTHVLVGRLDATSTMQNSSGTGAAPQDTDGDHQPDAVDVDDDNDGLIEIATLEQLDWIRNDLTGRTLNSGNGNPDTTGCLASGCIGYELVADLDFDTNGDGVNNFLDDYYDYYGNGTDVGWLPIGQDDANPFTAHFEGNGHTIDNMYINNDSADYYGYGLFGFINGVVINDVHLTNVDVTSVQNYIGGLVGFASSSSINNSSVAGDVTGNYAVGGLLGNADGSVTVTSSSSQGNVNGDFAIGGLIGNARNSSVIDSTSASNVTGISDYSNNMGGLIGYSSDGLTIENSTTSGNVSGLYSIGGLIGNINGSGVISNSHTSGNVSAQRFVHVIAGAFEDTVVITNSSGTGTGPLDTDDDHQPDEYDVDDDNDGLIEIATLQQLDWMRNNLTGSALNDGVNYPSSLGCVATGCNGYELTADLDFDADANGVIDSNDPFYNAGEGWLPVNNFAANFNGNNHRISNLYIHRPTGAYIGLFGSVNDSGLVVYEISNLILDGNLTSITSGEIAGSLAGSTWYVTINNVSFNGSITGNPPLGGLVGTADNTTINYCSTSGVVAAAGNVGGLLGNSLFNEINGSYSTATLNVTGNYAGGLIGYSGYTNITNSFSTGAVNANTSYIGGLIGYTTNTNITNTFSTSAINADTVVSNYVGGLIGDANSGTTITASYSTGTVAGVAANTGAFVGWSDSAEYVANFYASENGLGIGHVQTAGTQSEVTGVLFVDLQTAVSAGENVNGIDLFTGWGSDWDFGNSSQLPGLIINGQFYRDANGDGILD